MMENVRDMVRYNSSEYWSEEVNIGQKRLVAILSVAILSDEIRGLVEMILGGHSLLEVITSHYNEQNLEFNISAPAVPPLYSN